MRIGRIELFRNRFIPAKVNTDVNTGKICEREEVFMDQLNSMANVNTITFEGKQKPFEIGLSEDELAKRTSKECLKTITLLSADSPEFLELQDGDKQALKHLVKTAYILDAAFLKQDSKKNIPFRDFLRAKVEQGDKKADLALELFNAQNGINAVDSEAKRFSLMQGEKEKPGKGFYPESLSKKQFHSILIKMLEDGEVEEVKSILSSRSIVKFSNGKLKAVDYTVAFAEEFKAAAKELIKAAEVSTNEDFNEFLRLQADALLDSNPMAEALADKKWATLQDVPLDFTISKECYDDQMTPSVTENKKLKVLLDKYSIEPISKDNLGFRVGIVNRKGTEMLLQVKQFLPGMAENMPFNDKYVQCISVSSDIKQAMVDVDLVALTGEQAAYRGGITLAENLPSDDKLALKIGGGRRNVYHRQVRQGVDSKMLQKILDATLVKKYHQFYNCEAHHWLTIGHENVHSLGPSSGTEALGKYKSIIEENKADMGALAMIDLLKEQGLYDELQRKQMIVTFVADSVLKAKPSIKEAHRVRTVMQLYYMIKHGAVNITPEGLLDINIDKVIPIARKMLEEIIQVQLSQDFDAAKKYVEENFVWTDEMQKLADKVKEINKKLNGKVESPLAEYLLIS